MYEEILRRKREEVRGIAVVAAAMSGACRTCPCLYDCGHNGLFTPPPDAWCEKHRESYAKQLAEKEMARRQEGNHGAQDHNQP